MAWLIFQEHLMQRIVTIVGGGVSTGLASVSLLGAGGRAPRVMQNPTKGWAIVARATGEVLVNNREMAALLGYGEGEGELAHVRLW